MVEGLIALYLFTHVTHVVLLVTYIITQYTAGRMGGEGGGDWRSKI